MRERLYCTAINVIEDQIQAAFDTSTDQDIRSLSVMEAVIITSCSVLPLSTSNNN